MNLFGMNLTSLIISLPAVLLAIGLHEAAHGFAAHSLGDPTAKAYGRLTLNPLAHIDVLGMICLILFQFGWAKPVPVDTRYFKKPKRDMALVAFAGPLANILLALAMLILIRLLSMINNEIIFAVAQFCNVTAIISLGFAVFNLLPVPPLDGSKIIAIFFSPKWEYKMHQYIQYIQFGFFILLFLGVLSIPLGIARGFLYNSLWGIVFFNA